MDLVDRIKDISVPYSLDSTFEALKKAILRLSGFKAVRFDDNTKTAYLKARASWVSWGENLTVSLKQIKIDKTAVTIISTPKTGILYGGAIDFGKNRENIEIIIQSLLAELDSCLDNGDGSKH